MSSERSLHIHPPMDPERRHAAMKAIGLTMPAVAEATGVEYSHVYRVVYDQKHGVKARQVMAYIASRLSLPVERVFPLYERRGAA